MNDVAGNYIRLIDTADSIDEISEITNRAAWDVSITNQEYCEIYDYAVNKVRDLEVNEMKINKRKSAKKNGRMQRKRENNAGQGSQ